MRYGWSLKTAKLLVEERFVTQLDIVLDPTTFLRPWEIHFKTLCGDNARLLTNGYSDKSKIGARRFASVSAAQRYIEERLPEAHYLMGKSID
ncbi:TPA: hypothetical protein ACPY5O_003450 [Yersinia enterocolitica]